MRKFLIGIGMLVVLVIGAAIVVPSFVDWNSYKSEIQQQVRQATGRNLTIVGDLDLTILPAPRLRVKNVRFANVKGGSLPDMIKLDALDIQIRVLPMLQGRIEVASVLLIKPMILLERLADGRANWEFAPSGKKSADKKLQLSNVARASHTATAVQLDNVRIQNGAILWRDTAAGTEERLENVSWRLSAGSLNGPFDLRGNMTVRNLKANIEAAIGELKPTTAAPISLAIELPKTGVQAQINGSVVAIGASPRFTGKINLRGKDLRGAIMSFSGGTDLPDALQHPFLLRANMKGSEKGGAISGIDIEVGGTRAAGNVDIAFDKRPKITGKLAVTRIDLDSLLKPRVKEKGVSKKKTGTSGNSIKTSTPSSLKKAKSPQTGSVFVLPDLDGFADLTIDAITYNKRNIRGVELSARLAKNSLQVTKAKILLPGGGESNVTGVLSSYKGRANYQATIAARADNLRALLTWLGTDVAAVPQDRLRKFSLSASIRGDDQQLQVLNAKVGIDTTNIDGAVTLALRKRLAFGASIRIDNFDVDAYQLPTNRIAKQAQKSTSASKPSVKRSGVKKVDKKGAGTSAPLAALTNFDANVNMQMDRLIVKKTPVRGLRFEGTLAAGVLKIKNASVRNVGGMRASIAGRVSNLAGLPTFSGTVSADARDISGPLRLAGITPPPNAKKLGALRLRGKADAGADRVDLDMSFAAAGASSSLKGTISNFETKPKINATVTVKHRKFSQLLRMFGGDPVARQLGPFGLNLGVNGDLSKLAANLKLTAAGGKLAAIGTARGLIGTPAFALNVTASHPSVRSFVRHFVPEYRPAGGALGPLAIKAELSGQNQNYSLGNFSIGAGAMVLSGTGNLDTRKARPKLTAVLNAKRLDLNPFLPPKRTRSSVSPVRSKAGRGTPSQRRSARIRRSRSVESQSHYSSKRIDTGPLGLLDADISIAAKSLLYRQFKVDTPTINATLANKLLTIKKIAGKMFDGTFLLNGNFDARRTPRMDGRVVISKANVGKALFQTGTFDIKGGITDFDLGIRGAGSSPLALVRNLNGAGKLSSRNGIISGFDLKAVSDRLKNIDGVIDILSLFLSSMQGGQSRFSTLDATFKINKGIAQSNDVLLRADAAEGRATGYANLPKWHMDFGSQFRLIEHPKAPAFKMRAVGPIDNPRRFFDFKDLQSFLLQRGVGSLIRKVFPGQRRPNTQSAPVDNQQQQQQRKKPRLEDLIPGVFDLLNRR